METKDELSVIHTQIIKKFGNSANRYNQKQPNGTAVMPIHSNIAPETKHASLESHLPHCDDRLTVFDVTHSDKDKSDLAGVRQIATVQNSMMKLMSESGLQRHCASHQQNRKHVLTPFHSCSEPQCLAPPSVSSVLETHQPITVTESSLANYHVEPPESAQWAQQLVGPPHLVTAPQTAAVPLLVGPPHLVTAPQTAVVPLLVGPPHLVTTPQTAVVPLLVGSNQQLTLTQSALSPQFVETSQLVSTPQEAVPLQHVAPSQQLVTLTPSVIAKQNPASHLPLVTPQDNSNPGSETSSPAMLTEDVMDDLALDQVPDSMTSHPQFPGSRWDYRYDSSIHEPMSTTDEYADYYGSTANGDPSKREQKRRPKPKDGSQLICGVCGDKALGYNFDAITCESCKAFFRRNALKTKVFTCSFDGNCKLDTHTRKFCSGCRLKKCFDIGMKKDWILSEEQLAKRRQKPRMEIRVQKQRRTDDCTPTSASEVTSNYDPPMEDSLICKSDSSSSPFKYDMEDDNYPIPLSEDIRKEIENLEFQYNNVFDTPYTEDQIQKLTNQPKSPNDLFNLTDMFVRRLIKFARHIPEFKNLQQEDQIHLLKGGIMEIMVLRSAMGFDNQIKAWKIKGQESGEKSLGPQMIEQSLGSGMYTEHVKFVLTLNQLTQSNKTIMTLLFVIELFSSDRPNLKNKEMVSQGQEKFSAWLRAYLESLYPLNEARSIYPKLLMKLLDVRSLGESGAQLAAHLDITRLEPLLVEVFSLQK